MGKFARMHGSRAYGACSVVANVLSVVSYGRCQNSTQERIGERSSNLVDTGEVDHVTRHV